MAAVTTLAGSEDGVTEEEAAEARRGSGDLGSEPYDPEMVAMVMASAPSLFAVVEYEVAHPEIARVMGFGVSADEWVHVVSVDGKACGTFGTTEEALKPYSKSDEVAARVVWVSPAMALQKMLMG
ncbi:hypothetical protein BN6_57560 [Saccharothrix espanaensis DSM 44229]|uniref:Uncharacterized protein n=1 Tax=Saccharothrix espanaensis (strain ATCC 51144 / DSM 44229 / JCM 9112 / NBRC 15066 / NRRL 15764) TaxID=1179773 RepID=K0K853_SACES|nr:hypothetical protein BN6_57560 [Saccharothrix espanaensis DSM 44229]